MGNRNFTDAHGNLLARIETEYFGGGKILYDITGNPLGRYDRTSNCTYDTHGNLIG